MRVLFLMLLAVPSLARAGEISECLDEYSECKETCSISFGGTTDLKKRSKLGPCLDRCSTKERDCRGGIMEEKSNGLDDGALKRKKGSEPLKDHVEELREEPKKEAVVVEKKEKEVPPQPREEKKPALKMEVKTEDEPVVAEKPAPVVEKKVEEPAPVVKPKVKEPEPKKEEPKKKRPALDEWDPEAL